MTTVGLIPARGGSKRVRSKNTSPLLGRPLMAWTCDAAKAARLDAVYVSTEDADVREVARREGVGLIDRPEEYATDTATTESVLLHAAEALHLRDDAVIVCLPPTSPLRTARHIDEAVALLTPEHNGVVSVMRDRGIAFGWDQSGPRFDRRSRPRTQDTEHLREQGAIYVVRVGALREHGVLSPDPAALYLMDQVSSTDIDCYDDLEVAAFWLTKQLMRRKSEYAEAAGWRRGEGT